MIEKFINCLDWARSKNTINVWIYRVISYIFLFFIVILLWKIGKEYFFECSFSRSSDYFNGFREGAYDCRLNLSWDGGFQAFFGSALTLWIIGSLYYEAFNKIPNNHGIHYTEFLIKGIDRGLAFVILFFVSFVIWKVTTGGMYDFTLLGFILGGLFFLGIIASTLYGVWKKITTSEFSIIRILFNTTLPFLVGIILLALWEEYSGVSLPYGPSWYIYLFGGLYALSPIVNLLKSMNHSQGIFLKFLNLYSRYIVAFLIGFTIFMVIFWISALFDDLKYIDWGYTYYGYIDKALRNLQPLWTHLERSPAGWTGGLSNETDYGIFYGFVILITCVSSLFAWRVLTYAWKNVDEAVGCNFRKSAIWMAILFISIWLSPDWKEIYINNRIDTAEKLLLDYGKSPKAYEMAAQIGGLKWAMKERYKEGELHKRYISEKNYGGDSVFMETYNPSFFSKIFNVSIENEIDIYNELIIQGDFRNFKYSMKDRIIPGNLDSKGRIIQIFVSILLFPIMSWFILSEKKSIVPEGIREKEGKIT